jgi:hypothetical protein
MMANIAPSTKSGKPIEPKERVKPRISAAA